MFLTRDGCELENPHQGFQVEVSVFMVINNESQVFSFFAESQRLAFFDTATKVRRLNDDASDKFLEIIQPTDVLGMIGRMPECTDVVTTGGKASDELLCQLSPFFADGKPQQPKVGEYAEVSIDGRLIRWWRMPLSSLCRTSSFLESRNTTYRRRRRCP